MSTRSRAAATDGEPSGKRSKASLSPPWGLTVASGLSASGNSTFYLVKPNCEAVEVTTTNNTAFYYTEEGPVLSPEHRAFFQNTQHDTACNPQDGRGILAAVELDDGKHRIGTVVQKLDDGGIVFALFDFCAINDAPAGTTVSFVEIEMERSSHRFCSHLAVKPSEGTVVPDGMLTAKRYCLVNQYSGDTKWWHSANRCYRPPANSKDRRVQEDRHGPSVMSDAMEQHKQQTREVKEANRKNIYPKGKVSNRKRRGLPKQVQLSRDQEEMVKLQLDGLESAILLTNEETFQGGWYFIPIPGQRRSSRSDSVKFACVAEDQMESFIGAVPAEGFSSAAKAAGTLRESAGKVVDFDVVKVSASDVQYFTAEDGAVKAALAGPGRAKCLAKAETLGGPMSPELLMSLQRSIGQTAAFHRCRSKHGPGSQNVYFGNRRGSMASLTGLQGPQEAVVHPSGKVVASKSYCYAHRKMEPVDAINTSNTLRAISSVAASLGAAITLLERVGEASYEGISSALLILTINFWNSTHVDAKDIDDEGRLKAREELITACREWLDCRKSGEESGFTERYMRSVVEAKKRQTSTPTTCCWCIVYENEDGSVEFLTDKHGYRVEAYFIFPSSKKALHLKNFCALTFWAAEVIHCTAIPVATHLASGTVHFLGAKKNGGPPIYIVAWGAGSKKSKTRSGKAYGL